MNEREKYNLMWRRGYGNNYENEAGRELMETVRLRLLQFGMVPGDRLLDVGGGDQRCGHFFPDQVYTSLDIADEACLPTENAYPHIVADISEWCEPLNYNWAMAIDVMEHLPVHRVDQALHNISQSATDGAIFVIGTLPDTSGRHIGEVLHLTVRPPPWWEKVIAAHWDHTALIRVSHKYCIVGAIHVR